MRRGRVAEDPHTRRPIDMFGEHYLLGQRGAHEIVERSPSMARVELLQAEILTRELIEEDPDLSECWPMYVALRAAMDTLNDYLLERSDA